LLAFAYLNSTSNYFFLVYAGSLLSAWIALFMTSGLFKDALCRFILEDAFPSLISVSLFFNLGYFFGSHYKELLSKLKKYDLDLLIF